MSWPGEGIAETALTALVAASWKGGLMILLVLAVQAILGDRLPPRWRYGLWLIPAVRLLLPQGPPNPLSLFRLAPAPGGVPMLALDAGPQTAGAAEAGGGLAAAIGLEWPALLLALWALGAAALLATLAVGSRRSASLVDASEPVRDRAALELLERCRERMGIRGEVRLLETPALASPALAGSSLFGGRRPAILLPAGRWPARDPLGLRHVFLHELAHLAHRDGLSELLIRLLTALHWFNPLAHLAARRARIDREAACDQRVLDSMAPTDRHAYGRSLIRAATAAPTTTSASPQLSGLLGMTVRPRHHRHFHRRIEMIARYQSRRRHLPHLVALLLVLAALGWTDFTALAGPGSEGGRAADPQDQEKQRVTVQRVRESGVAIYRRTEDVSTPEQLAAREAAQAELAAEPEDGSALTLDWSRCPAISHRELAALVVPAHIDELPATDGWGHELDFCLDRSLDATLLLMGVRSPGRDGEFAGEVYTVGKFPPDEVDRDVVWVDGYFITWPQAD